MKKSLSIILALVLILAAFSACAKKTTFTSSSTDPAGEIETTGDETTDESKEETKENKDVESKTDSEKTESKDNKKDTDKEQTKDEVKENDIEESKTDSEKTESKNNQEDTNMEYTKVKFTMENGGEFVMELYPEYAPETAKNFEKLVSEGFYDGLIFHRVIAGFMAQGGDPTGTGMGGSKETIKGEFAANGFTQNTLSHQRGVVSMARSQMPNSASSQFFICFGDESFLDGNYAAFGKVIEGMEVVDEFAKIKTDSNDRPLEDIVIKTAVIVK